MSLFGLQAVGCRLLARGCPITGHRGLLSAGTVWHTPTELRALGECYVLIVMVSNAEVNSNVMSLTVCPFVALVARH